MDSFRESRIRNYRVKSDAGFTCQFDGCEADWGLLVVHVRSHVEARCKLHRKNLEPNVGEVIVPPSGGVPRDDVGTTDEEEAV